MRKRLITPTPETVRSRAEGWLDVERAAIVEITSEEKDYPVESIFVSGETRGWRAAEPGPQTIRLVFDQPQRLKQISLVFEEEETARTQEFVLRWSSDGGDSFREIVRQQWNFSPPQTIREKSIFVSGETRGWRAAEPGPQTIRLVFDQPQRLKQISLVFEEE